MTVEDFADLSIGDPAPWFKQRSPINPAFAFDTVGGRYIVLCFFGSAAGAEAQQAIAAARGAPNVFNDNHASFFGVSNDPEDETRQRVSESYPGHRYFWDFDGSVSRAYGAMSRAGTLRPRWIILDPVLRVLDIVAFDTSTPEAIIAKLAALPPPERFSGRRSHAPVLLLPRVFEPELCEELIAAYRANTPEDSGFMRDLNGRTVHVLDYSHKRRRDVLLTDEALIKKVQARVGRRIAPEIFKAHQFQATRMERNLVACYAAEDAAHFRPHRDNTTKGTAHRRFAVSINLNADFDGGELLFPEYRYGGLKLAPGEAAVFSCSLLHSVTTVTRGERFAFLPFLYDEAAAKQREGNNEYLGDGIDAYRKI